LSAAALLRAPLLAASRNRGLRALAAGHGMRFGAARFVAGTTLDDFVRVARAENARGLRVAAGYLGEGVRDVVAARSVGAEFVEIATRIAAEGLDATVATKLTHLGLEIDEEACGGILDAIVGAAERTGGFVRIDMEESIHIDATLRTYRALRRAGRVRVGVVLQAYLHRSAGDLAALAPLAANVRLVKGAYLERAGVAFQVKRDVDRNFVALIESALRTLPFTAIATHDAQIIEQSVALARRAGARPGERFEFQMLRGVREPLQAELVQRGFPVRVSVPFGADWYPYLMRRMAENPANLALILRNWRGSR